LDDSAELEFWRRKDAENIIIDTLCQNFWFTYRLWRAILQAKQSPNFEALSLHYEDNAPTLRRK
jgi:hypothetical protein